MLLKIPLLILVLINEFVNTRLIKVAIFLLTREGEFVGEINLFCKDISLFFLFFHFTSNLRN